MSLAHQTNANGIAIDQEAVLRALNLNPRDPNVQALLLVSERYGLDPVLKHAVLIKGNLYVTRDGLLHVAHRSGVLDGIVVEEEGENDAEWWAKVTVHVKGQTHGYSYRGRYPKSGHQKQYGPEMAVKCAEVMALRRAFGVTGIATVEEQWDKHDSAIDAELVPPPQIGSGGQSGATPPGEDAVTSDDPAGAPPGAAEPDPVPSFIDRPDNPDGKDAGKPLPGWLKGLHAHMGETFGQIPKRQMDAYRRRLVIDVSGEGKSSRELSEAEREAFAARLDAYGRGEWHWEESGDDWVIVEGPGERFVWGETHSSGGGYPEGWDELAGPGKTRALKAARAAAEGAGLPVPSSFDEVTAEVAALVGPVES